MPIENNVYIAPNRKITPADILEGRIPDGTLETVIIIRNADRKYNADLPAQLNTPELETVTLRFRANSSTERFISVTYLKSEVDFDIEVNGDIRVVKKPGVGELSSCGESNLPNYQPSVLPIGTGAQAIEFALTIDDHFDMRGFLDDWMHGDVSGYLRYQTFLITGKS